MKRIAIATALSFATLLPAAAQDTSPSDERLPFLVEAAVPSSVGSPELTRRLLAPQVGPQMSQSFDARKLEKLLDDKLPPNPCVKRSEACVVEDGKGSALRMHLVRGSVRYSNRERSEKKQPTTLPPGPTMELARKAAAAFGIPAAELGAPDFRYLGVGAGGDTRAERSMSMKVEGHVRFQRHIGGIPVAFSKFFVAADSRGKIARANARWPDFQLQEGLRPESALTRAAVVEGIVRELSPSLRPGTTERVVANVVYAPIDLLVFGESGEEESPDRGGAVADDHAAMPFAPALLVTVLPVQQAEDSGVTQMPAQNFVFPLFSHPPDTDLTR